jgi:hypothetical protein
LSKNSISTPRFPEYSQKKTLEIFFYSQNNLLADLRYNNKDRKLKVKFHSNQSYVYARNQLFYKNFAEDWISWLSRNYLWFSGTKYLDCDGYNSLGIPYTEKTNALGINEKYYWINVLPNYFDPYENRLHSTHLVSSASVYVYVSI